jgi:hypothetical protein
MNRMCMKIVRPIFAALLFIGTMGSYNAAFAANGIILEQEMTPGSYCYLKFPAIREETLAGDHPVLKVPNEGNLIDFYGPCYEDPVGKDQVHEQRIENRIDGSSTRVK